ncbi:MAG TPA: glycosyltransferase family 4 protein [Candidatus Angelobacter sp.]
MKIMHLISSEGFYGAENVVAALAHDLQESGNSACIGIFENAHASPNSVAGQFESRGLQVIRIPCRRRVDRAAVRRIREIIRIQEIDLVHSHGYKSDIYAWLAVRRLQMPLMATSHLWTRQTAAVRFYEFLDGLVLRRFDAVAAVSARIAGQLRQSGVSAEKITVIDNGIDLRPFQSAVPVLKSELKAGDRLLIGTVGRLTAQKGMEYFLTAARQLLKDFPQMLFAIVGDGPDREKLEQMAKDLNIEKSIHFTGARSDMPAIYASLDIFVLASVAEGMPMALLEAMASGRPVVATAVGAVPQVVVVGRTGMLVRARDAAGLADALANLLRHPELCDRLARNGQTEVRKQFSSQVMTQKYCKLYAQLLDKKNGRVDEGHSPVPVVAGTRTSSHES